MPCRCRCAAVFAFYGVPHDGLAVLTVEQLQERYLWAVPDRDRGRSSPTSRWGRRDGARAMATRLLAAGESLRLVTGVAQDDQRQRISRGGGARRRPRRTAGALTFSWRRAPAAVVELEHEADVGGRSAPARRRDWSMRRPRRRSSRGCVPRTPIRFSASSCRSPRAMRPEVAARNIRSMPGRTSMSRRRAYVL